jgi:hypothetical protein
MQLNSEALEHAIEEIVDVNTAIEVDGDRLVVTGIIDSPEERRAILDVLNELEPRIEIVDNLELGAVMPEEIGELRPSEMESEGLAGAVPGLRDGESLEPGDFTDQQLLNDPDVASGPSGTHADDDVSEGDTVYIPPTDPVRSADGDILGGFQTTSDEPEPLPTSEVVPGFADGALEEAVLAELAQDASTTALDIEVTSNRGVITLRGIVDDIDDAENAEAVAARIPGVVEVSEQLAIRSRLQGGQG